MAFRAGWERQKSDSSLRTSHMNAGTRQILQVQEEARKKDIPIGERRTSVTMEESPAPARGPQDARQKSRVFVSAENRLLREALCRMLTRNDEFEVLETGQSERFRIEDLLGAEADILVLASRENRDEDVTAIRMVRTTAPKVKILLIGLMGEESEFIQCVRAGVHGYLPRDASSADVMQGIRALQEGKAVCPGALCATLFRYFENEATHFPSASAHQKLGLTRREQQMIPLIAEGLTNKEIANRFCLSEQTVKNHLYRMKHKIGAEDRLGIVQVCRTQGFLP
jgi:DNA-binding NarL/FixJ family response regulator